MTKNNQSQKGFTLIELLLFLGMFSVILMVLSALFTAIIDTQLDVQATSAVEGDSKYITSRLIYDISRAQSITTPSSIGATTSSLTLLIDSTVYVYSIQNGNLLLTVGSDAQNLNSEGSTISSINFTRIGNTGGKNAIRLQLQMDSTTPKPDGPEVKLIDTTIGLR